MVGWTGKDYKFDFDVGGFFKTSVVYFGMAATAFYVIRIAFWIINRVHKAEEKKEAEGRAKDEAAPTDSDAAAKEEVSKEDEEKETTKEKEDKEKKDD